MATRNPGGEERVKGGTTAWHIVKYRLEWTGVDWRGLDWICKTWSGFVKGGFVKGGFAKTDNFKLKRATRTVRNFFFFAQIKSETVQ